MAIVRLHLLTFALLVIGSPAFLSEIPTSLPGSKMPMPPSPTVMHTRPHYLWDDASLHKLFENNRHWVDKMLHEDPMYFKRLAKGQSPQFLFIGCSDSRVPAQEMMGLKAGEIFVHRNVANLVVNTDLNLLSVIQYAVEVLKIKDILVCGHYGCGGVKAAMENMEHGLIDHWLQHIRDVQRLHMDELREIKDEESRHRRLIELNIQEQCLNLCANSIVQRSIAKNGFPRIHGLVYDINNGYLRKLDIDFRNEIRKIKDIYEIHQNPLFEQSKEIYDTPFNSPPTPPPAPKHVPPPEYAAHH